MTAVRKFAKIAEPPPEGDDARRAWLIGKRDELRAALAALEAAPDSEQAQARFVAIIQANIRVLYRFASLAPANATTEAKTVLGKVLFRQHNRRLQLAAAQLRDAGATIAPARVDAAADAAATADRDRIAAELEAGQGAPRVPR